MTRRRLLLALLGALLALGSALLALGWRELEGSRPRLEGKASLSGLRRPVWVERDALGTVTLEAGSRHDLARALGFVHAQERFFEMDLMRRAAAGELAELVGRRALALDRERRAHRFRERAREGLAGLPAEQRELLEAYAEGVRAGIADLARPPFPYGLIGAAAQPWRPEDSLLVIFSMYFDLQGREPAYDLCRLRLERALPGPVAAFLAAPAGEWEALLPGEAPPPAPPPIPGPELIDLRTVPREPWPEAPIFSSGDFAPGSNAFAVSGAHTEDGRALLANDMHLGLRVPNLWFRVRLRYPGVDAVGLSLPGVPGLVAGSNGRLAWGFTNAYGDFAQWVALPEAAVVRRRERFALRGGAWHEELLEDSPFGPVLARLPDGTPLALAWTAHRPGAADLGLFALLEAGAIEEALTIAAQAGMPAQNLLLAAADGRIAWGIAGRLPERLGPPAALLAHDDPRARWRGWIEPARQPRRVDPAGGRLWSANARMVAGEDGERIGDGGLVLGARARQIRDALLARERLDERGALTIQLDDRALFLQRWREVLLTSLDALEHPLAGEARRRVAQEAERAAADAVGYRLLREFRLEVHRRVAAAIVAAVRRHDPAFEALELPHFEGAVWRLLEARPAHWLGPHDRDWDGLLAAAATAVLDRAAVARGGLEGWTWGERNRALIRHPLSLGMPWLGRWLDAPADPLPGDLHMPRVQGPVFGASQRLAVRPGRETSGLLHMPGGQSGHPRSPFYLAGHEDWVRGRPAPLLPGAARHRLELSPEPKASAALPWAGRPSGEAADARPRTR